MKFFGHLTRNRNLIHRIFISLLTFILTISLILPAQLTYANPLANLPTPGTMVTPSAAYIPTLIRGITVFPENPLQFDFIVDNGQSGLENEALKVEATKLIKYFLASLTVPKGELWVNLSPYEKDRIIPDGFGQTEMGRDLLAQDYVLKQLTASLVYPEQEIGKEFWSKVYAKAQELYGTTDIPLDTFNKVWVIPEDAMVYEKDMTAFVVNSHLRVMLEEDYNASIKKQDNQSPKTHTLSPVIREVVLPAIEKEVNEGKNFANLRQIYNSMILAIWYKQNLQKSLLGQVYVGKNKTKGVDIEDPDALKKCQEIGTPTSKENRDCRGKEAKQKIYNQYLEAFKKGAYDYIKQDYDPRSQQIIDRKYFSGGAVEPDRVDPASLVTDRARIDAASFPTGQVMRMTTAVVEDINPKHIDRAMVKVKPDADAGELAKARDLRWEEVDDRLNRRLQAVAEEERGTLVTVVRSLEEDVRQMLDSRVNGDQLEESYRRLDAAQDSLFAWDYIHDPKESTRVSLVKEIKLTILATKELLHRDSSDPKAVLLGRLMDPRPFFPGSEFLSISQFDRVYKKDSASLGYAQDSADAAESAKTDYLGRVMYHAVPKKILDAQRSQGVYIPERFAADGFIHFSATAQTALQMANRFYGNSNDEIILLKVNVTAARRSGKVVIDSAKPDYPHFYAALPLDVISEEAVLEHGPEGFAISGQDQERMADAAQLSRKNRARIQRLLKASLAREGSPLTGNLLQKRIHELTQLSSKIQRSSVGGITKDDIKTVLQLFGILRLSTKVEIEGISRHSFLFIGRFLLSNEEVRKEQLEKLASQTDKDLTGLPETNDREELLIRSQLDSLLGMLTLELREIDVEVNGEMVSLDLKDDTRAAGVSDLASLGYVQDSDMANVDDAAALVDTRKAAPVLEETAVSNPPVGGIDLNPDLLDLQIKRDGKGIALPVAQQPIESMKIEGFLPVIINVTPVTNLPLLLGLNDSNPAESEKIQTNPSEILGKPEDSFDVSAKGI